MKATITQIDASRLNSEWEQLKAHVAANRPEFLLLPEMGFAPWLFTTPTRDASRWTAAVRAHQTWLERLPDLGAPLIAGAAPRTIGDKRYNIAYIWTRQRGLRWIHQKTYLPNDEGYWEANWYDRAPIDFQPAQVNGLRIGLMICTEIWFLQHAREYGKRGIHLLLNPRSTPAHTNAKWLAGGQTAAVVAGAFCLSSNHAGKADSVDLGGCGWICDPDGVALATTDAHQPFVTLDLDLALAEAAKSTYPRYVDDSPL